MFYTTSILILIFLNLSLGFYCWIKGKKLAQNILFAFITILMSFWAFSLLINKFIISDILNRLPFPPCIILAYVFVLFSYYFPKKEDFNKRFLFIAFLPTIFLLYCSIFTKLITVDYKMVNGLAVITRGPLHKVFAVYFIAYISFSISHLLWKVKTAKEGDRNRIWLFLVGLIFSSIFGTTTNLILPMLGNTKFVFLGGYASFILIFFTAYSIIKFETLNIRIDITHTIAMFIVLILLFFSFLMPFAFFSSKIILYVSSALVCIFWLFFGEKIKGGIQNKTEKKLIKNWYDQNEIIDQILHKLALLFTRKKILLTVTHSLVTALHIEEYFIINAISNEQGKIFKYQVLTPKGILKKDISPEYPIIKYFKDINKIVVSNKIPDEFKVYLENINISGEFVCLPFYTPDSLEGVTILKPKDNDSFFKAKDLTLFKIISKQVQVYLERMRPYEKITASYQKSLETAEQMSRNSLFDDILSGIAEKVQTPLLDNIKELDKHRLEEYKDSEICKTCDLVKQNLQKTHSIIETMFKYYQTDSELKVPVNLQEVIEDILVLNEIEFRKKQIPIVKTWLHQKPVINGLPKQFYQLFSNIILNALESMRKTGILSIIMKEENYFDKQGKSINGFKIEFIDKGMGIRKEDLKKIYDPFFSTKDSHSGLGLSLVLKTLDKINGMINIESAIGLGTIVTIHLPRNS
jgi:signal transduction histidine kinase